MWVVAKTYFLKPYFSCVVRQCMHTHGTEIVGASDLEYATKLEVDEAVLQALFRTWTLVE